MSYQAKKRKKFEEILELVNENGDVIHVINVKLDADDMVVKINQKYRELTRALAETTEMKRENDKGKVDEECFEKLGKSVIDLFEAVFGKEDTETIVEFYERRYVEMVKEITPFITKCVIPRCIEIKKENQNDILKSYNRKQRRMFKRMKH